MSATDRLDRIEARAQAATEGQWSAFTTGVRNGDHWSVLAGQEAVCRIRSDDGDNEDQREPDAEFIAAARTDVPALVAAVRAVLKRHTRVENLLCGAMAEVPHRHGGEQEPYPVRPVTCTREEGHDGDHKDAVCCWNFQTFTEAARYKSRRWADRSTCGRCGESWPCATVRAVEDALGGERA